MSKKTYEAMMARQKDKKAQAQAKSLRQSVADKRRKL